MQRPTADEPEIPKRRILLFFAIATLGCLADLLSKHFVFQHPEMYHGSEWWLWEGHLGIQKSLNEGALFGIGQGNVWLFATLSIAAAVAIPVWLFVFRAARDPLLTIALGCVLGGILGNLYDRVGLAGLKWDQFVPSRAGEDVFAVRDFILMQWNDRLVWPNYNIADALLVLGACFLLFHSWYSGSIETAESDIAAGRSVDSTE